MSCKFHLIRLILKNRVGTPNYSVRMNSNCMLAFTEVMTHDRMRQSYAQSHSVLQWRYIADTMSTETGTTGEGKKKKKKKLEYFIEFSLFQSWTWWLTMFYVTLWGSWFVCACVCISLLSIFIIFNPSKSIWQTYRLFESKWLILRIWHGQLVFPLGQVENSSTGKWTVIISFSFLLQIWWTLLQNGSHNFTVIYALIWQPINFNYRFATITSAFCFFKMCFLSEQSGLVEQNWGCSNGKTIC